MKTFTSNALALAAFLLAPLSLCAQSPSTLKSSFYTPAGAGSVDGFGSTVALSGTLMVAGAPYDDTGAPDAGSVYIYDLAGPTPTVPVLVIHNPSPVDGDYFGFSVALSGGYLVVGAMASDADQADAGLAYVYDLSAPAPTVPVWTLHPPSPVPGGQFGFSTAIAGSRVVVGASYAGAANEGVAYAYDLSGASPTQPVATFTHPSPAAGDQFGYAVAISGTRVLVGAPFVDAGALNAGAAYVYDLAGATPGAPSLALTNPSPSESDEFGYAVALSGPRALVGAPRKPLGVPHPGAAFAYDLGGASPANPTVTLRSPGLADGDAFGAAVALSGATALVGAPNRDVGAMDAGSVHTFNLAGATPSTPVATITNSTPLLGELFGTATALDGFTAIVGALSDTGSPGTRGASYVVGPASNDTDADGLLDLWEYAHFGTLAGHSAQDDADGDGTPELLELAFDRDPLSPEPSPPPPVVIEGGYLTLTIAKRAGVTYLGQSAASPAATFSAATTTVLIDSATTLKFRDNTLITNGGARFLRVKVTAAP